MPLLTFKFSKFSRGRLPDPPTGGEYTPYPPPHAALTYGAALWHTSESGTFQFLPATFYKNENPVEGQRNQQRGDQELLIVSYFKWLTCFYNNSGISTVTIQRPFRNDTHLLFRELGSTTPRRISRKSSHHDLKFSHAKLTEIYLLQTSSRRIQ